MSTPTGAADGTRRLNPATSDRIYDDEERDFLRAVQDFREKFRSIPTLAQSLKILKGLGYAKKQALLEATTLPNPTPATLAEALPEYGLKFKPNRRVTFRTVA